LRCEDRDRVLFVAVVPRVGVVGWVAVSERRALLSSRRADIEGLVVEDEYRGNRIGEMLVDAAEAWARRRGCTALRLLSNVVRERAHEFYRRLGYDVLKTEYVFQKSL
jgi:GNAT superfamily N-acetyltransferase